MRIELLAPPGALLIFDFESTLASRRRHGNVAASLQEKLKALDELYPVAVFGGLPIQELRERLGFTPRYLVGDHGLEGLPAWEKRLKHLREVPRRWREQLEASPELFPLHGGAFLENRRFSLALHYRSNSRQYLARRQLLKTVLRLDPIPRVLTAKCVISLIPAEAPGRSLALDELVRWSQAPKALLIGSTTEYGDFHSGHPENLNLYPLARLGRTRQLEMLMRRLIQLGHERQRGPEAPFAKTNLNSRDQFLNRTV